MDAVRVSGCTATFTINHSDQELFLSDRVGSTLREPPHQTLYLSPTGPIRSLAYICLANQGRGTRWASST
jgi:hypothetical protein